VGAAGTTTGAVDDAAGSTVVLVTPMPDGRGGGGATTGEVGDVRNIVLVVPLPAMPATSAVAASTATGEVADVERRHLVVRLPATPDGCGCGGDDGQGVRRRTALLSSCRFPRCPTRVAATGR
jgi:hypothetical protein